LIRLIGYIARADEDILFVLQGSCWQVVALTAIVAVDVMDIESIFFDSWTTSPSSKEDQNQGSLTAASSVLAGSAAMASCLKTMTNSKHHPVPVRTPGLTGVLVALMAIDWPLTSLLPTVQAAALPNASPAPWGRKKKW
jgi:hypothetical protein